MFKGWIGTKNLYPVPASLTPLPFIPVTTDETTGCNNEAAKGANKASRDPPSCFLFRVLLFQELQQLTHPNLLITFWF